MNNEVNISTSLSGFPTNKVEMVERNNPDSTIDALLGSKTQEIITYNENSINGLSEENAKLQVIDAEEVISNINDHISVIARELHFNLEKVTGTMVITVVDSATDQVVRQIPSEDLLKLAQKLLDDKSGLLEDNA